MISSAKAATIEKTSHTKQWADRIRTQLGKSVESILEVGRLLIKAKADLPHGEWGRMFEDGLVPFSQQTANKLMTIAEHPLLSNHAHGRDLPPSWTTLYELTKVPERALKNALKDGAITADMPRKDVAALMPKSKPGSKSRQVEPDSSTDVVEDVKDVKDNNNVIDSVVATPKEHRDAYFVRVDYAIRGAFYEGSIVDKQMVIQAQRAATAWAGIAAELEKKL